MLVGDLARTEGGGRWAAAEGAATVWVLGRSPRVTGGSVTVPN